MKQENVLSILVITFLVFGCGAPSLPSEPTVTSPTATPLPTATEQPATPTPTSTPLPTAALTPEPGLQTNGPYFAYFQQDDHGIRHLVLMDADGVGKQVIELPEVINGASALNKPSDLDMRLISPDGKWMAFYTGSAGSYGEQMPAPGTSDLTLNLLDLESGKQQVLTPLLSSNYPNNFVEAAEKLNDPYITAVSLYGSFLNGITTAIAWSPDGRYLAFAGQMDGLSSDLYVYDVQTKTIQRLSSGDQELQWINWSPDGKWVLHSGVFEVGEGMTFDIYAATVGGSSAPYLSTNSLYSGVEKWLNDHTYFENDSQNGLGDYGLRLVDIKTGEITKIWDGAFLDYQVDPNKTWLVLFAFTSVIPPADEDPNFVPGLQLINLKTLKKSQPLGHPETFLTVEEGKIIPLDLEPIKNNGQKSISLSPDSKYWVVVTPGEVEILSSDLTELTKTSVPSQNSKSTTVMWRPDSSGFFLVCGTDIYSVNIPDGKADLVETNLADSFDPTYKWINSQ